MFNVIRFGTGVIVAGAVALLACGAPGARATTITGAFTATITTEDAVDTAGYWGTPGANLYGDDIQVSFSYTAPTSETVEFGSDYVASTFVSVSMTINGNTYTQSGDDGVTIETASTDYANVQIKAPSDGLDISFGTTTPVTPGDLFTQAGLNAYLSNATIGSFYAPDDGFPYFTIDSVSLSTDTPEPASLTVLGVALAGLGAVRRRSKD